MAIIFLYLYTLFYWYIGRVMATYILCSAVWDTRKTHHPPLLQKFIKCKSHNFSFSLSNNNLNFPGKSCIFFNWVKPFLTFFAPLYSLGLFLYFYVISGIYGISDIVLIIDSMVDQTLVSFTYKRVHQKERC